MTRYGVFGRIQIVQNATIRVVEYGFFDRLEPAVARAQELQPKLKHVTMYIRKYVSRRQKLVSVTTLNINGIEEDI